MPRSPRSGAGPVGGGLLFFLEELGGEQCDHCLMVIFLGVMQSGAPSCPTNTTDTESVLSTKPTAAISHPVLDVHIYVCYHQGLSNFDTVLPSSVVQSGPPILCHSNNRQRVSAAAAIRSPGRSLFQEHAGARTQHRRSGHHRRLGTYSQGRATLGQRPILFGSTLLIKHELRNDGCTAPAWRPGPVWKGGWGRGAADDTTVGAAARLA